MMSLAYVKIIRTQADPGLKILKHTDIVALEADATVVGDYCYLTQGRIVTVAYHPEEWPICRHKSAITGKYEAKPCE